MFFRFLCRHQSAIRSQKRQLAGHAADCQLVPQAPDITPDDRTDGGIGNGCQCPLIFLHFRQNLVAQGHRHILDHVPRHFPDPLFMRAIGVGIDERHGDGLHALCLQLRQGGPHTVFVKRADFLARSVHATVDRDCVFERCQGLRFGPDDPGRQTPRHIAAGDLHDVTIAFCRDEADARALPFQNSVGGDGRSVEKELDILRRNARFSANGVHAIEDAFGTVMRSRRRLVPPEGACFDIEKKQVRERASNVNTQPITHTSSLPQAAAGNAGACATIPGSFRPMTPASQWLASTSFPRSMPVAMPARSSM